ncbi:hypothetical protein GY45DRAFT_1332516 [Cubamyces sp. BRFM 1775]|nr:hypothetical protein GY45DRAFT_1332516 [Cubamyces sp. BRFM 1775]
MTRSACAINGSGRKGRMEHMQTNTNRLFANPHRRTWRGTSGTASIVPPPPPLRVPLPHSINGGLGRPASIVPGLASARSHRALARSKIAMWMNPAASLGTDLATRRGECMADDGPRATRPKLAFTHYVLAPGRRTSPRAEETYSRTRRPCDGRHLECRRNDTATPLGNASCTVSAPPSVRDGRGGSLRWGDGIFVCARLDELPPCASRAHPTADAEDTFVHGGCTDVRARLFVRVARLARSSRMARAGVFCTTYSVRQRWRTSGDGRGTLDNDGAHYVLALGTNITVRGADDAGNERVGPASDGSSTTVSKWIRYASHRLRFAVHPSPPSVPRLSATHGEACCVHLVCTMYHLRTRTAGSV